MYSSLRFCYGTMLELASLVLSLGFLIVLVLVFGIAVFFMAQYTRAAIAVLTLRAENDKLKRMATSYRDALNATALEMWQMREAEYLRTMTAHHDISKFHKIKAEDDSEPQVTQEAST